MSYYHTCPICGANLDPGERCDCSPLVQPEIPSTIALTGIPLNAVREYCGMKPYSPHTTGDCLIIGYDESGNYEDHVILTVARKEINGQIRIINSYIDDEAKDLYSKLVMKNKL